MLEAFSTELPPEECEARLAAAVDRSGAWAHGQRALPVVGEVRGGRFRVRLRPSTVATVASDPREPGWYTVVAEGELLPHPGGTEVRYVLWHGPRASRDTLGLAVATVGWLAVVGFSIAGAAAGQPVLWEGVLLTTALAGFFATQRWTTRAGMRADEAFLRTYLRRVLTPQPPEPEPAPHPRGALPLFPRDGG